MLAPGRASGPWITGLGFALPGGSGLAFGASFFGVDGDVLDVSSSPETAAETTNPLLYSRFAHEGAILNILYSTDGKTLVSAADDKTVKLWDAAEVKERAALEKQPDWPQALALLSQGKTLLVGRLDGSMEFYDVTSGKIALPAKPALRSRIGPCRSNRSEVLRARKCA